MLEYEICQVPTYKEFVYELNPDKPYLKIAKKTIKPIDTIKAVLLNDLQLHERLNENDLLKLSVDIDKLTEKNKNATKEKVFEDICEYVGINMNDISYTTNFSVKSGSHHVIIPKYFMKSVDQKKYWYNFRNKYGYGKEIDADIFGKNCWFRLPNQTKEGKEGTEHIIQKGEIEDFVLKYVEKATEYPFLFEKEKQNTIKFFSEAKKEDETTDEDDVSEVTIEDIPIKKTIVRDNKTLSKKQELLQLIRIDKKDRTTWMRVCSCIKYNKMNNKDWVKFCQNNDLNMDTEKKELFKNTNPYPIEIYYLQSLAKQSNPSGYKLWLEKYDIYFINADDLDDPYKTALTISNTLKDTLTLCKENWYMLTDNQLWKQQKEPSFYIINELRKYIDESNKKLVHKISQAEGEQKDKLIEKSKIYLKSYKSVSGSSFLNVLTKYLKTLLADDKFVDKLDANKGQLAFQNGIMDLETKVFRQGIFSSDFITQTIPYDYVKGDATKKEFIKSVLLKILNNNVEHLEYFLSIIGYTFIGSPNLEKSIYFCVDKTDKACGDNGKTFFFDILSHLLPNYVYKSKGSLLEEGNTKVHKQLAMMKGKRLIWLDEFGKKKSNSELMKEIGDGLNIENEVMFGTSETINIMFKLFTLTNNMPIIDPKDTAVYNRYKQISYGSHFDRTGNRVEEDAENLLFIADTSLGDKIKSQYYNEVFDIIIEYANKYYLKKIPCIPSQFIKDTKETQKSNDAFANWFDENCEININERVALKALVLQSGMSEKLVKEGMTRMGFKYNSELKGIGKDLSGKYYKGGYLGIKLSDIVEEE
jgi:phage/plasmid-associated DNA primase